MTMSEITDCAAKPDEKVSRDGDDAARTEDQKPSGRAEYEDFKLSLTGKLIFFTLAVLTLMVSLDGTSISVALPEMAAELNGSAMEAFWSGTSFLLCSTVFQPSTATLSNIFGRRPLIIISVVFFFVGALVAGLAHNFTEILVGRCIQGVGGGGIAMLSEVVVTDLVPLRLRGNYYGILSAAYSLGSVLGPIVGGGFSENVTWRWIFYINFPFIGLSAISLLFFRLPRPPGSFGTKLLRIDYLGTILFVSSVSSFLIPLSWGGVMHPWSSWRTLLPLILGSAGLIAFTIYEIYIPSEPMIPASVFTNRSAVVSFVASTLQGLILWSALYYLPLYYEAVKEFEPILTGVALFPETFTVAPSAIFCGVIITVTGRYRWGLWVGWALSTLGLGLVCLLKPGTSTVAWIFLNITPGLGLGILTAAIVCTVQASSTNKNLTVAVAMVVFFRAFGQAIGIAIGGVIFQNRMKANLGRYDGLKDMAAEYSRDAAALVTVIKGMGDEGVEGVRKGQLKEAYTDSLRVIWGVMCAVSGVGLVLSAWVEKYDLNRALEDEDGKDGRGGLLAKGQSM
ncbi:MFS general substrate transporter [Aspergillus steynii IBT 23096]|uniref:MFS general substrate transporter n=1 Tax=Aspergillus steynii IBT 23096 TaxID=1392250 RepID=A0A2I2GFH8_9EURO|nr:MFS general substrate transporter [Aspergillus steynii IBT 23096]PLB51634.1 MFS general substrate transporter [Aspergillus steynii IBT 23096]